ncbi:hypothetical protein K505DRAFT_342795 [Melanomma pulvis-pyrius CBS 109.77]|uniref:AA1-like domain-containing protein n=1 Tax=Melanomma pulvis-pyrius CBS 109.77 TaxID=1314802 RepID=A0A6A6WUN5_9PLEO|nr:hypothetical protein K505DRAFT_342795 [Melanomma pulvis-pyrius CBS 109.77]
MVSFTTIALLSVAQLAAAHPNPPPAFQVTNLNTFEPSGRPGNENVYRVGFSVTDPSDSSATTCEAVWDIAVATTGYPATYLANCTDPSYAFKFVDYHSYYDFVLDVKHTTKKHGKKTTKFAKALVDFDIIQCTHAASGFSVCSQKAGVGFALPVYGVKKH